MRLWMTPLVLAVALVSRPGAASADWITIEPDAFAPGTDVTHATPGVTLWTMTPQDPLTVLLTPTYVRQDPECLTGPCSAVTGSQGFSSHPGASGSLYGQYANAKEIDFCVRLGGHCDQAFGESALWMQFDAPVDIVEIGGVWLSDFIWMKAYNENFQEVDRQDVPEDVLPREEFGYNKGFSRVSSVNSLIGNIKYVIAGSVGGHVGLDAIGYQTVVPEPSTLLLCGVGFVGLLRSRHRSRR